MKKRDIESEIAELKEKLVELENERDNVTGIRPSETKDLIMKWYGHCFTFDGIENGSLDFMLESIKIDRKNKTVRLDGNLLIYVTPDISFLPIIKSRYIDVWPYGGKLMCKGEINIDVIPYVPDIDWSKPVAKQIDEILTNNELSYETFSSCVEEADDCCDNFDYVTPMEDVLKDKEKGYEYDYKHIFDKL